MYVQAVNSDSAAKAGLALIPSVLGVLVGSLAGGLVIQVTGKYYAYTVANFTAMVVGSSIITLAAGTTWDSFVGIELGLCFKSLVTIMGSFFTS